MAENTVINANNKRIAKNTTMLYIRMLLTMGVSLYTVRIVLNTLGTVDYGVYSVAGGIVTMFSFLRIFFLIYLIVYIFSCFVLSLIVLLLFNFILVFYPPTLLPVTTFYAAIIIFLV